MKQTTALRKPAGVFNPDNLQVTFSNRSDQELKLAYWLFHMMGKPALVKAGGLATVWALKLGLPVKGLIRNTIYKHFCGGESVQEAQEVINKLADANVHTVLDYAAEAQDTEAGFNAVQQEILQNIELAGNTAAFSYISIKLTGLGPNEVFEKLHAQQSLTQEEQEAYNRTNHRLDNICAAAAKARVRVYIDAEECWLQRPFDALAEEMMRRYNTQEAVVFNTLQMYRTDRVAYLEDLLSRFKDKGTILGIKLVRGAYLEKEQERAEERGYPCPVFKHKQATDQSFNQALSICLSHLDQLELCAATHNADSITYLTEQIQEQNIENHRQRIHFSQLYGMSDNLTYNLADAGYNVSKYLPYGEVATAVPYLIRRAEENTSIAGQMSRELAFLAQEIKRRNL